MAAGRDYQRRFGISYPLVAERFDGGTTGGTLRAALAYLVGE